MDRNVLKLRRVLWVWPFPGKTACTVSPPGKPPKDYLGRLSRGGIPADPSGFPPRPSDGKAAERTHWTVVVWDPRHGWGEVPAPRSSGYTHGCGGAGDPPTLGENSFPEE